MLGSSKTIAGLLLLVLAMPALARWEGPEDNKPLSELEQMDLKTLFNEGFDVCVRRAVVASGLAADATSPIEVAALDYLSVIEGVVRDKSGGKMPEWMRALGFARSTKECQTVFRGYVSGELRDTRPAHAAKPSGTEATPEPEAEPDVDLWVTATPTTRYKPKPPPKPTPKPTKPRPTATARPIPPTKPAPPTKTPPPTRPKGDVVDELPPWFRSR